MIDFGFYLQNRALQCESVLNVTVLKLHREKKKKRNTPAQVTICFTLDFVPGTQLTTPDNEFS